MSTALTSPFLGLIISSSGIDVGPVDAPSEEPDDTQHHHTQTYSDVIPIAKSKSSQL